MLGFAAEPGKAALDGPAGGNSPYAVALLRHLSAMTGLEFGTVMRMVTEVSISRHKAAAGLQSNGTVKLEEALRASMEVLATRPRAPLTRDWAMVQNNLGLALQEQAERLGWLLGRLGEVTEEPDLVQQGRDAVAAVWAKYKAAGNCQFDTYFGDRLKAFDKTLAELR